jgi:hypothetical protein
MGCGLDSLAQDRVQWRVFVNTVMNLRFLILAATRRIKCHDTLHSTCCTIRPHEPGLVCYVCHVPFISCWDVDTQPVLQRCRCSTYRAQNALYMSCLCKSPVSVKRP